MLISADQPLTLPLERGGLKIAAEADLRLRRALLQAAGDHALLQDQIDAAELALSLGLSEVAARLFAVATLQNGFGAQTYAVLRRANEQVDLWPVLPQQSSEPLTAFAVDRAIADLRSLMRLQPRLQALPDDWQPFLPPDLDMAPPPIGRGTAQLQMQAAQVADIVRQLPAEQPADRAERLRGLADALLTMEPIHLNEHVDFDIAALADLLVMERTRAFVLMQHDLIQAEPSQLLIEASAQHFAALGPYFSNLPGLLRSTADIFALIDAASEGGAKLDEMETWAVLLSAHLRQHEVNEFIEELGDRGMVRALGAILLRLMRRGSFWRWGETVRKVRDVYLDISEYALAAVAQHVHTLWFPTDAHGWMILAEIQTAAGKTDDAVIGYNRALALKPQEKLRERPPVIVGAKAAAIAVQQETSAGRRRLRIARMQAYRGATG